MSALRFSCRPVDSSRYPPRLLIFRASGTQVATVDAQNKIDFKTVEIARDNGSLVELSSGVAVGDRLVLNISSQLASGQTVAANEADATTKPSPLGAKR